jgi:outer membrane protein TolC
MKIPVIILSSFISLAALAQQGVDEFLELVEQNNKELLAARKLADAEKSGFQTGLTPDNPTIEYGHFPGNNDAMGTKTTYGISQSFDFPTVYSAKKKLAANQSKLSELEYQLFRQDKLLEAKLKFYDYAFLLKMKDEYQSRLAHSTQLYRSSQTNFDKGNTSILDLNKARIQNLKIKSNYQLVLQEIESTRKELELLAGEPLEQADAIQLSGDELPLLAKVLEEVQEKKPELHYLKQAQMVAGTNVKLAKQNWLPDLQLTYEGEKVPEGTYRGIRAGISIPLWKDKNTVQQAQARVQFESNRYDSRITAILNETEKIYNQAFELQKIRLEYKQTLEESANVDFLDKALNLGQISVIDYFNELTYYYETMDAYLEIEKKYYQLLAQLWAFQL